MPKTIKKMIFVIALFAMGSQMHSSTPAAKAVVQNAYNTAKKDLKKTINLVVAQLPSVSTQDQTVAIRQALADFLDGLEKPYRDRLANYQKKLPKNLTNADKADISGISRFFDQMIPIQKYLLKQLGVYCNIEAKDFELIPTGKMPTSVPTIMQLINRTYQKTGNNLYETIDFIIGLEDDADDETTIAQIRQASINFVNTLDQQLKAEAQTYSQKLPKNITYTDKVRIEQIAQTRATLAQARNYLLKQTLVHCNRLLTSDDDDVAPIARVPSRATSGV